MNSCSDTSLATSHKENTTKDEVGCTRDCTVRSSTEVGLFKFKDCFTPTVTEIIDSSAVERRFLDDVISLKGRHFSTHASDINVTFSRHACIVLTSSAKEIKCRINVTSEPPMNTWLTLSIHDTNYGDGLILPDEIHEKSVIFRLSVDSVHPSVGSISGGTSLIVQGYGLNSDTVSVLIGGTECQITLRSYALIGRFSFYSLRGCSGPIPAFV